MAARSPLCKDLIQDPRVLAQCDRLLLTACERYQLHLGQVIRIMPGEKAQSLHKDRWAWGTHLKGLEPQLNTIWALTDFTRENGATRVVPGSTGWPDDRRADPAEITQAVMSRGAVLIYTGSVVHGGGANSSDADRVGLNITYALG
nr:phytanoyl-CoA dioxygenase family protein [Phenylobacterium sp.]